MRHALFRGRMAHLASDLPPKPRGPLRAKRPHKYTEWRPGKENGRYYDTQWVREWATGTKGTAAEIVREGMRGPFEWHVWTPDMIKGQRPYISGKQNTLEDAKARADAWIAKVGIPAGITRQASPRWVEVTPGQYSITTMNILLTVMNSHRDSPGKWVYSCPELDLWAMSIPRATDAESAKQLALKAVRSRLERMLRDLS